jgi:hypothetical protein
MRTTANRHSFVTPVLWATFALAVAAIMFLLLRACALGIPDWGIGLRLPVGWAACNSAAASPAGTEDERGRQLADLARQLELQLTRNQTECLASRGPAPTPPTTSAAPALPADRWDRKELGVLDGCWTLGQDTESDHRSGATVERCTVKANSICFTSDGRGERETRIICPQAGTFTCKAPITAAFQPDGALHTTQPEVPCTPSGITWFGAPNYLTCRRTSDNHATCRTPKNYVYEFRRAK